MDAQDFTKIVSSTFNHLLLSFHSKILDGAWKITGPYSFPTTLRIGESPSHYIAELTGVTRIKNPKNYKIRFSSSTEKVVNTSSFINPGPAVKNTFTPGFSVKSHHNTFSTLTFATEYDLKSFKNKINFPVNRSQLIAKKASVPILLYPESNYVILRNIDLIRTDNFRVFFKTIHTAFIIRKEVEKEDLKSWLYEEYFKYAYSRPPDILGLNIGVPSSYESFARSLLGLIDQGVSEDVIDRFIQAHSAYFVRALGYEKALCQKELNWIERDKDDPQKSQPDYLMKRKDGYFDILDLKTAAMQYTSLTKGSRARCSFVDYVDKLIAQLDGYKRYFEMRKNSRWAFGKYGVKVKEPRLIGVVGTYENFKRENIDLALRPFKDSISIIGYFDLIDLLRKRQPSGLT